MAKRIFVNLRATDMARPTAAIAAGGREAYRPEDGGHMYARAFEHMHGHGFGPFRMDMAAMPAPGETAA